MPYYPPPTSSFDGVALTHEPVFAIAGRQETGADGGDGETLGAFTFNKAWVTSPASPVYKLRAVLAVFAGGQTATLQLFDFTNGVEIATLTSTSTTPELKTSAGLTLAAGDVVYLVRLKRTGGAADQPVYADSALLEVS